MRRVTTAGLFLLLALLAARVAPCAGQTSPESRLRELREDLRGHHPPGPAETASRLSDVGMAYLAQGDAGQAIELLSEAVARDPDNGVALANLTLAYLKHGDYDFAEFYLDLARRSLLRTNPDPAVYVSLGEIYALQNRTDDAIAAWQEARRLGDRSTALLQKVDRAWRDWAFTRGQKYRSGDNFQIFYDSVIPEESVLTAENILNSSNAALAQFFMSPPLLDQVVILYRGRRFFSATETPDWVAGLYDGRIRVPIDLESNQAETLPGLLRHEMAHAFLQTITSGKAPAWLQEGLAQYVEGRRVSLEEVRRLGVADLASSLEDSVLDFHQRTDRERARRAYALSLSYVQSLIQSSGTGAVVCVAVELGRGRSLAESFREQLGAEPSALEAAWRREMEVR